MKLLSLMTFLLGFALFSAAQDTILYKFNNLSAKNWQETESYEVINYTSADSLEATTRKYKKNGDKISLTKYVNYPEGIKNGEQQKWFSDGTLAVIKNYKDGKLSGALRRYTMRGEPYYEAIYENGVFQSDTTYEGVMSEEEKKTTVVESMPLFKGCERYTRLDLREECTTELIVNHIATETKYPKKARRKSIEGTVYVSYVIGVDGKVEDLKVFKGVEGGELLEAEAVRVMSVLPDMIPGVQFGEYVRVQYNVPIKFKLVD